MVADSRCKLLELMGGGATSNRGEVCSRRLEGEARTRQQPCTRGEHERGGEGRGKEKHMLVLLGLTKAFLFYGTEIWRTKKNASCHHYLQNEFGKPTIKCLKAMLAL